MGYEQEEDLSLALVPENAAIRAELDEIFDRLNHQQGEVVQYTEGPLWVVAGA